MNQIYVSHFQFFLYVPTPDDALTFTSRNRFIPEITPHQSQAIIWNTPQLTGFSGISDAHWKVYVFPQYILRMQIDLKFTEFPINPNLPTTSVP